MIHMNVKENRTRVHTSSLAYDIGVPGLLSYHSVYIFNGGTESQVIYNHD